MASGWSCNFSDGVMWFDGRKIVGSIFSAPEKHSRHCDRATGETVDKRLPRVYKDTDRRIPGGAVLGETIVSSDVGLKVAATDRAVGEKKVLRLQFGTNASQSGRNQTTSGKTLPNLQHPA